MNSWALYFKARNLVRLRTGGVLVDVRVSGQVLLEAQSDGRELWATSIYPAGFADHGETLHQTLEAFYRRWQKVLEDSAEDVTSAEEFQEVLHELSAGPGHDFTWWEEAARRPPATALPFPRKAIQGCSIEVVEAAAPIQVLQVLEVYCCA